MRFAIPALNQYLFLPKQSEMFYACLKDDIWKDYYGLVIFIVILSLLGIATLLFVLLKVD